MTDTNAPAYWPAEVELRFHQTGPEFARLLEASIPEPDEFATYTTLDGHGWLVRRRRAERTTWNVEDDGVDANWFEVWLHLWTAAEGSKPMPLRSRALGVGNFKGYDGWGTGEMGLQLQCLRCQEQWVIYPPTSVMGMQVLCDAGRGGMTDPCPVCEAALWDSVQRVRAQHRRHVEHNALHVMQPAAWARHFLALTAQLRGGFLPQDVTVRIRAVQAFIDAYRASGRTRDDMPPQPDDPPSWTEGTGDPNPAQWRSWWALFWHEAGAAPWRKVATNG